MYQQVIINNTPFYYKLVYSRGGYNSWTRTEKPRGYKVSIQRQPDRFMAFEDISHEQGANMVFLEEAKRFSQKKFNQLQQNLESEVVGIVKEILGW